MENQIKPFNFPVPVANAIAGLCCMKEIRETEDGEKKTYYVLPQGAPTSPLITNMICDKLDHRLAGVAKRFGLNYSRYADDITFSSMHNVYQKNGLFFNEIERIIKEQGFTINEKKTRLQKIGGRQEVTGIIVSQKLNVSQKYVRDIRNILYIWDKYGYSVAYSNFLPKYKTEKGHVKKGIPDMVNVLDGKLLYMKMVKGESDSVYLRLFDKFEKLSAQLSDLQNTTSQGITYVETMPLLEFEKKNSTNIVIVISKPKKTKTENDSEIQKNTHRYAYFMLDEKKMKVSVNKSLKAEEISHKENLAISNCRDAKGAQFWLMHAINKVTVPAQQQIDINELNNDLDLLLNNQLFS